MPAYIAFLIDIRDQAAFSGYARAAAATYAMYGGGVALRGPIVDLLEGDLEVRNDTRLVVLQFPSLYRARAWWHSPQYQAAVKLRQHPVSDSRVFLVDGIDLGNQHAPQRQKPSLLRPAATVAQQPRANPPADLRGGAARAGPQRAVQRPGRWHRSSHACFLRCCPGLMGGAAPTGLPGRDISAALAGLVAGGAGLPADRLALGSTAVEPSPDPRRAAPGLLLGHPPGERDQDVQYLRRGVQPGFPDANDDAAALLELADDPQRALGRLRG